MCMSMLCVGSGGKKKKRREVKKLVQNSNSGSQTEQIEKWKPTRGGQRGNTYKSEEEDKMPQKSHICVAALVLCLQNMFKKHRNTRRNAAHFFFYNLVLKVGMNTQPKFR